MPRVCVCECVSVWTDRSDRFEQSCQFGLISLWCAGACSGGGGGGGGVRKWHFTDVSPHIPP